MQLPFRSGSRGVAIYEMLFHAARVGNASLTRFLPPTIVSAVRDAGQNSVGDARVRLYNTKKSAEIDGPRTSPSPGLQKPILSPEAEAIIKTYRKKYKRMYSSSRYHHERLLKEWNARGPPPLSEYRLTFGKHAGRKLDEVPDAYLVKYLVPLRSNGFLGLNCPLVADAVEDYVRRTGIESQAGPAKTRALEKSQDVGDEK